MGTRWTRTTSRTPVLSQSGHRHRWSPVAAVVVGMVAALLPALPAGATTSSGTSSAPAQRAPGTAPSALAPDHVASTGAGLGLSVVLGAGTKTTSLGAADPKAQSLAAPAGHGSPSLLGPRGASTHQATSPTSGAVTTSAVTTSAVSTPSSSGGPQFGSPDWSNVANPNPVPPSRELAGAALDSSHNRDFIFGGLGIGSAFLGDTWAFNGTTWSQANPSSSPSARDGVQMAYDQATSTTYLFGGYNGSTYLGDTWAFNGTTWTQLSPATSPAPRANHPGPTYRLGSMIELDTPEHSVAGILAWYSTIHLPPPELDRMLTEFRRLLASPGILVAGFFDSDDDVAEFDHKVITAYRWPADVFAQHLAEAGFTEVQRLRQRLPERPDRAYAAIAVRVS